MKAKFEISLILGNHINLSDVDESKSVPDISISKIYNEDKEIGDFYSTNYRGRPSNRRNESEKFKFKKIKEAAHDALFVNVSAGEKFLSSKTYVVHVILKDNDITQSEMDIAETIYKSIKKGEDVTTNMDPSFKKIFRLDDHTSWTSNITEDGNVIETRIQTFKRRKENPEEKQYLDLLSKIIEIGDERTDRTEVGTRNIFGNIMRFSLRDWRLPLMTFRPIWFKGVVVELLWILSGKTDTKILDAQGVKFWNANATKEFLAKRGFPDREEGDLGPSYGHQFRHYGAPYINCKTDYTGQGIDQVAKLIHTLKTNPMDRRMIINAWNVAQIDEMSLPPCHAACQFDVSSDGYLSCTLFQRSADVVLGTPTNIASYSLLCLIMCKITGYKPGDFVYMTTNTHVYSNHIDKIKPRLHDVPREFPRLKINRDINGVDDIDKLKFEDFELIGYEPGEQIKGLTMAV